MKDIKKINLKEYSHIMYTLNSEWNRNRTAEAATEKSIKKYLFEGLRMDATKEYFIYSFVGSFTRLQLEKTFAINLDNYNYIISLQRDYDLGWYAGIFDYNKIKPVEFTGESRWRYRNDCGIHLNGITYYYNNKLIRSYNQYNEACGDTAWRLSDIDDMRKDETTKKIIVFQNKEYKTTARPQQKPQQIFFAEYPQFNAYNLKVANYDKSGNLLNNSIINRLQKARELKAERKRAAAALVSCEKFINETKNNITNIIESVLTLGLPNDKKIVSQQFYYDYGKFFDSYRMIHNFIYDFERFLKEYNNKDFRSIDEINKGQERLQTLIANLYIKIKEFKDNNINYFVDGIKKGVKQHEKNV